MLKRLVEQERTVQSNAKNNRRVILLMQNKDHRKFKINSSQLLLKLA